MQTANRSIEYIILLTRRVFSAFSNISLELRWKGTNSMDTELWIPPLMGAVSTPTRFFPEFFCTLHGVSFLTDLSFTTIVVDYKIQRSLGKGWMWKDGLAGIRGNRCQKKFFVSGLSHRHDSLRPKHYLKRLSSQKLATLNSALRQTTKSIPRNK